jgi:PhnO protein
MEIINADIEHLNMVYNLICELENETLNRFNFAKIYQNNIENNDIYYLLAVEGKTIFGFASLHIQKLLHHCANIGEIQEIIISKNQRGQGTGTALFDKIMEIARVNNCLSLEVCCNQVREKSHEFYLKQGMSKSHYKFVKNLYAEEK